VIATAPLLYDDRGSPPVSVSAEKQEEGSHSGRKLLH
jgi:hypothetical protein